MPGMGPQPLLAEVGVVALGGFEEGGERDLRVDDQILALGKPHHHVGPQHPVVGRGGRLLGEVAVRHHAGQLDRTAQVELAPAATHLRFPQRGGQRRGLPAERLAAHPHLVHLLVQLALPGGAPLLQLAQLGVQSVEGLLHDRLPRHLLTDGVPLLGQLDHPVLGRIPLSRDPGQLRPVLPARPEHAEHRAEQQPDHEKNEQQQHRRTGHVTDSGRPHRQFLVTVWVGAPDGVSGRGGVD